uniref:Uncharacterized protein n=1 Tax=Tetranychus urticae TaxID=32264 RepID=T1K0Y0_TETUR
MSFIDRSLLFKRPRTTLYIPELRVAAIETLELLDACNDLVFGKLRRMVMSSNQPNEVRTRALKVVLRCGDEVAISQIKSYIESHPEDKHFISYADSYLRNAMRTMNVDKQVIRKNAQLGQSQWKRNANLGCMDKLAAQLFDKINQIKMKDLEKIVEEVREKRDFETLVRRLTNKIRIMVSKAQSKQENLLDDSSLRIPYRKAIEASLFIPASTSQIVLICFSIFAVTAAVQKYYEITGDKKQATIALELILFRFNRASENKKVIYVRALSNIRFEANILLKTLEKYIESGKPELRVVAIETLELLDACNDLVYGTLRRMVMSASQPNEVRTRALKVVLRCGDEEAISQIKSYIESHPEDKHFISYADSYLRNAMRTMNVDKQVIRQNAQLGQSQWKEPKMTVSRNIEFSQRAILGKIGFNYEIDSIVDNGKEMPTWAVLNSSIALQQANQINFELGLRQEGMDKLAVQLFDKINQIKMKDLEKGVEEVREKRDFEPLVGGLTRIIEETQRSGQFSVCIKTNGIILFYWNSKPLASGLALRYKHER